MVVLLMYITQVLVNEFDVVARNNNCITLFFFQETGRDLFTSTKTNCSIDCLEVNLILFLLLQCLLSTVGDWDFNVFNLDKLTNGKSYFPVLKIYCYVDCTYLLGLFLVPIHEQNPY